MKTFVAVDRSQGNLHVVIRPCTGRVPAVVALMGCAALFARVVMSRHGNQGAWLTPALVWLLPVGALLAYNAWLFLGKQEITASATEISTRNTVAGVEVGMARSVSRDAIKGSRVQEVTRQSRGAQFVSRRLMIYGADGDLAWTLPLADRETATRLAGELGVPADAATPAASY